jgi:hypothetical protein
MQIAEQYYFQEATHISEQFKAKGLVHISVGQRPTYVTHPNIKAESLAYYWHPFIRKAFNLDHFSALFRRALPYANMRKAFSLMPSSLHDITRAEYA